MSTPRSPDYLDFGRYLQLQRELRGLSVDDVARQTKISPTLVSALESGQAERFPERVFVLNYVRSYAQAVGLKPDEVLSRFHNPFELAEVVKAQGYTDVRFHWYNYHPTYPMLRGQFEDRAYREAQMALEQEGTWRGMFLCSSGVIEATRA